MSPLITPAPLWRRLIASVYDGLLLLALWLVALVIDVVVRDLVGAPRNFAVLQLMLFLIGLGFFGWFWTHGGQTLGMRSWRLQLRRNDGAGLRWPIAALRYALMLLSWSVVLTPFLLRLPHLKDLPQTPWTIAVTAVATVVGVMTMLLDGRRRAPCDRLSGTEVVELPKAA